MPAGEPQKEVSIATEAAKGKPPSRSELARSTSESSAANSTAPTLAATTRASTRGPGWRLQLGAFSSRAAAEALYRKLSTHGSISAQQPWYGTFGKLTRLQIGHYLRRSDAVTACRELMSREQPCFPSPASDSQIASTQ
jgi:cell division septation protein DedD